MTLRAGIKVALAAGLALAVSACWWLWRPGFEQPAIQLRDVAVTGLSAEGGSLLLYLDVYNPNRYEIRTARLHVAIEIEGIHFGDALLESPLRLEARTRTPVQLPLTFTWAGVGAAARGILSRSSVTYDLAGRMLVGTPLGERDVGLRRTGSVSLRNVMR
ncbi:MAG: hypothetical protein KatS3mg081_2081 [Gemmatimonadales bacterium]|nr:hypothetical protein HRbin33_01149 [bacterium HR33]GIW52726.1 MAG: hypothetical protein KatS3mg081_2081 [Gemmatimonadales bacterium]